MNRQLPLMVAFGLGSAVLYAASLSQVMAGIMIAYLAQMPLFVAGLSMGVRAAAIAGGAGAVALALIGGFDIGALYAGTTALPVAVLTLLALRSRVWTDGRTYWYPSGNLLMATAGWCAAMLLVLALTLIVMGHGFEATVTRMVTRISEAIAAATGQEIPITVSTQMVGYLPGVVTWSWMLMATVNGLLAQLLVRGLKRNLRPNLSMSDIEVPLSWSGAFCAALVAGMFLPADAGFTITNIAIVMAYPLFFQGLSVIHAAFASFGAWTIGYVVFYLVMFFFGWLALAVVALGLAEPVLKLRERLSRPKSS